jgi:hypothetical protein
MKNRQLVTSEEFSDFDLVYLSTVFNLYFRLKINIILFSIDSTLTEDEDSNLRRTSINVQEAGVPEVNGIYKFFDIMCESGYYAREGQYQGKDVRFTLYKCNVNSGQFQWFISITPENCNPGTSSDIDFYIATAGRPPSDRFPPRVWMAVGNNRMTVGHPPVISYITQDINTSTAESNITSINEDSTLVNNFHGKNNNITVRSQPYNDFITQGNMRIGNTLSNLRVTQEDDSLSDGDNDSNTQQIDHDEDIDLMINNSPSHGSNLADDDEIFPSTDDYDNLYDER